MKLCVMDPVRPSTVTWQEVLTFARSLQQGARNDEVAPAEGAKLVRLVLEFNETVVVGGGLHKAQAPAPEVKAQTG